MKIAILRVLFIGFVAPAIKRLLKEKPRARGLVVPAMPIGSPGMEAGGHKDPYDVFLVNRNGSTRTYAKY